jgi:hypothetical protein
MDTDIALQTRANSGNFFTRCFRRCPACLEDALLV